MTYAINVEGALIAAVLLILWFARLEAKASRIDGLESKLEALRLVVSKNKDDVLEALSSIQASVARIEGAIGRTLK